MKAQKASASDNGQVQTLVVAAMIIVGSVMLGAFTNAVIGWIAFSIGVAIGIASAFAFVRNKMSPPVEN